MSSYPDDAAKTAAAELALSKSRDELLRELENIDLDIPNFVGAQKVDPQLRRENLLQAVISEYRDLICGNKNIQKLCVDEDASRQVSLVCAIVDLLHFAGAVTVAALITKEGILKMCSKRWQAAKTD